MIVQSPSADEAALQAEFKQFLSAYSEQVEGMTAEDLARYKASVLSNLQESPKNLSELNGRFIESVALGYTDFDFREQLAEEVALASVEILLAAYSAVTDTELRALAVETVDADQDSTLVDLRKKGSVYGYQF